MEETKNFDLGRDQEQEEKSSIDFQLIYSTLILNWKWFVLSLIVCLGLGYLYIRHARPQYQATAKVLIKDDDQRKNRGMGNSMIQNAANLGFISNSNGIDNEIEILSAQDLANQAVVDMNTMRLMEDRKTRLVLTEKASGKRVFDINLIDYLAMTNAEGKNLSTQEYLDRQSNYHIIFFLSESWLAVQIVVNGWVHRIQEENQ